MLPLNRNQIPALFKRARALEQAGKAAQAKTVYADILRLDRTHAPAHFQIGQILYREGDLAGATAALDKAAKHRPGEPAIWQLNARVLADLGDSAKSAAFLTRAKAARLNRKLLMQLQDMLRPQRGKTRTAIGSASPEDIRRAIDLLQSGRAKEAAKLAIALRKRHPDVAILADIAANALAATGNPDRAEEEFRAAIRLDPDYAEAHSNFGRFLIERGRSHEAIALLRHALKLAPGMGRALTHLGIALARENREAEAVDALNAALSLSDADREAHLELARLLAAGGQPGQSLIHLDRAATLGVPQTEIRPPRVTALVALERADEAVAMLKDAIAESPDNPDLLAQLAILHQSLGDFDTAHRTFAAALDLDPANGEICRNYLTTKKLKSDDPLIARMQAAFDDSRTDDRNRMHLGFALAKALEDSRQYDRVFTYLKPANDLMRKAHPYDISQVRRYYDHLKSEFAESDFQDRTIPGATDFAPIFVTGLPRSGTTLVEQIVASHSRVTGGGELGHARRAWAAALTGPGGKPKPWPEIADTDIAGVGREIESQMRALFPDADRLTDKSVLSYTLAGPILLSLPSSRMIVVRRDPRDTALSMYKNMFVAGKHLYSYDLGDLGTYFRLFDDLVGFWQEKLPGRIHVIEYESLIADPETQARALITACGLDWEDGCMKFHENTRRVDTLSVHQVRQPIYASSLAAWRRYENDLGPLFDALGGEYAKGE